MGKMVWSEEVQVFVLVVESGVEVKDLGVEWIGEVLVGWEVLKFKYICKFILDGIYGLYLRVESGYRLLSVRNIINGSFKFRNDDSRVLFKYFKEISLKFLIKFGDIQLVIVGVILGKVVIVENLLEKVVI